MDENHAASVAPLHFVAKLNGVRTQRTNCSRSRAARGSADLTNASAADERELNETRQAPRHVHVKVRKSFTRAAEINTRFTNDRLYTCIVDASVHRTLVNLRCTSDASVQRVYILYTAYKTMQRLFGEGGGLVYFVLKLRLDRILEMRVWYFRLVERFLSPNVALCQVLTRTKITRLEESLPRDVLS